MPFPWLIGRGTYSKATGEVKNMQTIRITITSKNPANVEIVERKPEQDFKNKLAELFEPLLAGSVKNIKEEEADDENRCERDRA